MHIMKHKLNMNHTVVMSICYCTISSWLRNNWEIGIFPAQKAWLQNQASLPLTERCTRYLLCINTLQIQKKDIKAKYSISLRKKKLSKMFHFLFCISPLDLSIFPMFISRNFFHLHRFSLLYFSIVFSSPLYNKQSISNLFIEVILLDSSNPWVNVLNSCDTLEKACLVVFD